MPENSNNQPEKINTKQDNVDSKKETQLDEQTPADLLTGINNSNIIIKAGNNKTNNPETKNETEKKEKINCILNKNRNTNNIKTFFESGSQEDFNTVFDYIKDNATTSEKEKFNNMVKEYIGSLKEPITSTTNEETHPEITISLKTTDNNSIYPQNTRIISLNIGDKPNIIVRGTQDHLQKLKAEKLKEKIPPEIFGKGLTGLNEFDGKGNYEGFKNFIESKGSNYVDDNLESIINGIKTYQPIKEPDISAYKSNNNYIKNKYSNILTDFVISNNNINLQKNYISKIKPENLTILGIDKKTQTENFNKIVKADLFKDLDETTKNQIINTKLSIEGTTKQNFEEGLKTGAKEMIKGFGGLILNIVELFGGKGLLKKFCSSFGINYDEYFGEIEKLYNEKYQLNQDQLGLLRKISDDPEEKKEREVGTNKMINREGKKEIPYSQEAIKNTYVKSFQDAENFKHLDPVLVEKALQTENIKKLNIEQRDNIIIQEKESDGKIIKKINPDVRVLIDNKTRESIVEEMINEGTRKEIQDAGNKISRSNSVYNSEIEKSDKMDQYKKNKVDTENNEANEKKRAKGLNDANDIGMYLGIYLMKGSGDLKYAVSQTDGIPKTPEVDNDKPDTKEDLKININDTYINTDGTLKGVKEKRIDEIFDDYTKSPDNLSIIHKGSKEEIKIKKETIKIEGKDISTYVYENEPKKRVIINDGDKLILPTR